MLDDGWTISLGPVIVSATTVPMSTPVTTVHNVRRTVSTDRRMIHRRVGADSRSRRGSTGPRLASSSDSGGADLVIVPRSLMIWRR